MPRRVLHEHPACEAAPGEFCCRTLLGQSMVVFCCQTTELGSPRADFAADFGVAFFYLDQQPNGKTSALLARRVNQGNATMKRLALVALPLLLATLRSPQITIVRGTANGNTTNGEKLNERCRPASLSESCHRLRSSSIITITTRSSRVCGGADPPRASGIRVLRQTLPSL